VEAGLREARRGASPEREAAKVLVGASVKQLFELARIVNLSETEIGSAENARRNAVSLADELRQQKEAIEEERDRLNAKIRDLDRDIIERDSRIADLAADLQGSKIRALQDLSNLKARFRRQIGEGLAGLLADAWDAIDTDPPHPDVARERLEIAREAIRRELEWLDKSSD
jgi:septal ring factor EnvC (AmiA/AmiB activator)